MAFPITAWLQDAGNFAPRLAVRARVAAQAACGAVGLSLSRASAGLGDPGAIGFGSDLEAGTRQPKPRRRGSNLADALDRQPAGAPVVRELL